MRSPSAREEARLEARALLVGEGGDLDGDGKALAAPRKRGHAGDGYEDSQHSVILAPVAHRIEVRAHEERGAPGRGGVVAADDAPGRVDAHRHAGRAHPFGDLARRGLVRGSKVRARVVRVRVAVAAEDANPVDELPAG